MPVPRAYMAPMPVMMPQTMQPNAMAPAQQLSQASAIHTQNLHQTYLNALNQMFMPNGQPFSPPNVVASAATAVVPPQVTSMPLAVPIPTLSQSKQKIAVDAICLQQKPCPSYPGTKSASEVPDFLSGFENVSGEDQRPPWMMPGAPLLEDPECNGVPLQCSPPLTSKSFDDLHQMLGSNLSPKPWDLNASKEESTQQQPTTQPLTALTNSSDAYAAFAQQSALAVSQHSAYCRPDSTSSGVHAVALASAPDMSSSLAAMYGNQQASVMSRANLQALQGQTAGAERKSTSVTSFPSTSGRIVSGSERSSDVASNEDGSSMHGSTSSSRNNETSDTTSNDSDSVSEEGPPRKKTKTGRENARNAREVSSPVSSDRSSPRAQ